MYIIDAAPITRLPLTEPQILSYFSPTNIKPGCIVFVPLGNRKKTPAIVYNCISLSNQKMALRKAKFQIKGVIQVLSPVPALSIVQLELAQKLADYYFYPLGLFLNLLLPDIKYINEADLTKNATTIHLVTLHLFPEKIYENSVKSLYENSISLTSNLSPKKRYETWLKIKNGRIKNVIGTRNAVFAPIAKYKSIIIEEEQNQNYKSSEQSPRFNAKKVARLITQKTNAKLLLKSSTPSIESIYEGQQKLFTLNIPAVTSPKKIEIVDLKEEIENKNYSSFGARLKEQLKQAIDSKKQVILFINRRGQNGALWCQDCAKVIYCPDCSAPFIYHKDTKLKLICHHCGLEQAAPSICPNCQSHRLTLVGSGTQKIAEEFQKLFTGKTILRLDSDITPRLAQQQTIIDEFNNSAAHAIIGTQMLLNHPVKKSALVAVINADTLLHFPDFRSNERTWQTLKKLGSFAKNNFIIQTHFPENPAIKSIASGDSQEFIKDELATRKMLAWPPFSQIIKLTFSHPNEKQSKAIAQILFNRLQFLKEKFAIKDSDFALLGPAPAFLRKFKNQYRHNIIIKSKLTDLQLRNKILSAIPNNWVIDVDPENII